MANASDDVTTLLRRADVEAYTAKRAGGNRVALADEDASFGTVGTVGADGAATTALVG
jgi:hypothetical protein